MKKGGRIAVAQLLFLQIVHVIRGALKGKAQPQKKEGFRDDQIKKRIPTFCSSAALCHISSNGSRLRRRIGKKGEREQRIRIVLYAGNHQ